MNPKKPRIVYYYRAAHDLLNFARGMEPVLVEGKTPRDLLRLIGVYGA